MSGLSDIFGGGKAVKIPKPKKEVPKTTAKVTPDAKLSEKAKRNRRLSASLLTRSFTPPLLSRPDLLGGSV